MRTPQELLDRIREGYRDHDAAKIASVYADDAVCNVVNRNYPPSRPLVLRGRAEVATLLADICARQMTHEISQGLAGDGVIAYRLECRYPDGCLVVGHYLSRVEGGSIVSESSIDCWDE